MRSFRDFFVPLFFGSLLAGCASFAGASSAESVSPAETQAPRTNSSAYAAPIAAQIAPPPVVQSEAPAAVAAPEIATPAQATNVGPSPVITEIDGLFVKARDAIDSNHLSEAIKSYISVIAIMEESPSPETKSKAEAAVAELQKIGGRLTLEPSSEWIDPKGSQVAGLSRSAGKQGGLSPSVYLFESFGSGKSPVSDAPIYFEFVKNAGSLVSLVSTDAYGKANTTIARIDEPGKEALVRAYPVFKGRGKSFAFRSVFRDFAYLPPVNVARVVALETSEFGASANPQIVDALVSALKPTGLQLAPFNAMLAPEAFRSAFGGDPSALAEMGAGASAPYIAFALVEIPEVRQTVLNGKAYNIFMVAAKATFRLVRSDGTTVFAIPFEAVKGQGGSREAAVADGYKRAREALVPAIEEKMKAIKEALAKE